MTAAPRRRLGVMGGTFDPIHHGHLVAASEVLARLRLDEVVFVPAGEPYQKAERGVSPAEQRFEMTVLATAAHPSFTASRVDLDRSGPTYTFDTLTALGAEHPESELFFITGADALANLGSWHRADELFALAHFVGCTRPGYPFDWAAINQLPAERITTVDIPSLDISSTDCRSRASRGEPLWYLTPDPVVRYLAKHFLYSQTSKERT